MNIKQLIEKENERHKVALTTIKSCKGLEEYVSFVNENCIYLRTHLYSLKESQNVLHKFKEKLGNYKLLNYYMNSDETIAVQYTFGSIVVILFCRDVEEMLKKVSGGKCRVEKHMHEENKIVCDI